MLRLKFRVLRYVKFELVCPLMVLGLCTPFVSE